MNIPGAIGPAIGTVVQELEELLAAEFVQQLTAQSPAPLDAMDRAVRTVMKERDARADHGGKRLDSYLEVLKTAEIQGRRLPADELNAAILQMAAAGYSEEAQADFVAFLKRKLALKDGKELSKKKAKNLSDVLETLRPALPDKRDLALDTLREFFRAQGFKLRTFDPAPDAEQSRQLHRRAYRDTLNPLRGSEEGLRKRDVRELLAHLGNTADEADLEWARWQVEGRIRMGSLKFANREAKKLFDDFFAEHLGDAPPVHRNALYLRARELRHKINGGEDAKAIAATTETFMREAASFEEDPDALYFAHRVLGRELSKARRAGDDDVAQLADVVENAAAGFFDPRLDGKLDRYSERHRIRRMVEAGELSEIDSWRMLAAVQVSSTWIEYTAAQQALRFEIQQMLFDAMNEVMETISDNMRDAASEDIVDSEGNVIISALELYLERLEKERQILERIEHAHELDAMAQRLVVDNQIVGAVNLYVAARTPGEKSDAAGEIASLLSARAALEPINRAD